ncbi:MAG: SpoIIE family protein phosphatase, partial [Clostridia bacterium]|nr:SpoIIE family protein phosphatase [Clostridia bacterium]
QYTDGVTEATNLKHELYGMNRLGEILNKVKGGTPNDILPAIKKDIDEFVGDADQFDDITMLCLEYKARMETNEEDAQ